jgi:hypothetical protein
MITLFVFVGVCLFLPFATASCGSASTTFTGAQLVTQTVPDGGVLDREECSGEISECVENEGSAKMTVALLAAALGSLLIAFGVVRGPGWCAAVGLGAILSLFQLNLSAEVNYHWGYGTILLLFLAVWIVSAVRARRLRENGLADSAIVAERPSLVVKAVVAVFWIDLCAALLAGYDFGAASTFALALFLVLPAVVSTFVGQLIRELARTRRRRDLPSHHLPSVQG